MPSTGNAERLTKLLELLLTINPDEFHMGFWSDSDSNTKCSVGFAMFDPWFQEEGLRPFPDASVDSRFHWPVYGNTAGFHAVGKFFNLPRKVTAWLFNPAGYMEPHHSDVHAVIHKLKQVLSGEYIPVGRGFQLTEKGGDSM